MLLNYGLKTIALALTTGLLSLLAQNKTLGATLFATTNEPTLVSDFSIEFDDANNNQILDVDSETILDFSGVTDISTNTFYDILVNVVQVDGYTTGGTNTWGFKASATGLNFNSAPPGFWSYQIVEGDGTVTVPEPSISAITSILLVGLMLGGTLKKEKL